MDYRELARKQTAEVESKIAKFTNYTNEDLKAHWDGKSHTLKAGQSKVMQAFKAFHFAEVLTNRELLRIKIDPKTNQIMRHADRTPVYEVPNGDKYVSPKKPDEVPEFKKRFMQAFEMIDDGSDDVEEGKDMSSEMMPVEKGENIQIANFPEDKDDEEFEDQPKEETKPLENKK